MNKVLILLLSHDIFFLKKNSSKPIWENLHMCNHIEGIIARVNRQDMIGCSIWKCESNNCLQPDKKKKQLYSRLTHSQSRTPEAITTKFDR